MCPAKVILARTRQRMNSPNSHLLLAIRLLALSSASALGPEWTVVATILSVP